MAFSLLQPILPKDKTSPSCWGQLHGCSQSLLIARTLKQHHGLSVLITEDTHSAYKAEEEIRFFMGTEDITGIKIHIFPDWETLPYDIFSPLEDIVSDRLITLTALPQMTSGLLIVSIQSLLHRLAPTDFIHAHSLQLSVGETLETDTFRDQLQKAGYRHVTQVMEHGEYANRGSLIDLFPMGAKQPFRIDLFDNQVETIRSFDPETQRSIDQLQSIELLPAHEFPLTEEGITTFKQNYRSQLEGDLSKSAVYQSVSDGMAPAGVEYYLPLFFEQTATLFDYLPNNTLILKSANINTNAIAFLQTVHDRYEQRRHDNQRPILNPEQLYLKPESINQTLENYPQIVLHSFKQDKNCHNYPSAILPSLRIQARAETPLAAIHEFLESQNNRTLFIAESPGRKEELLSLLTDNQYSLTQVESWQQFLDSDARHCITVAPVE
ncbi:MAG TPA: transcription-repair coupling factor, partial [Thiotrichaceae bacterium]|nr:transcription-repair coupling factor [Thiotrichaceae bacterium]